MGAGSSTTENISKQVIRTQIDVLDKTSQLCQGQLTQEEVANFSGNVVISGHGSINFNETATMNFNCLSNVSNSSQIVSDLSQAGTQLAKSIAQNVTVGLSTQEAYNLSDEVISSGINITNASYQRCIMSAYQSEQLNVPGSLNITDYGTINFNETSTIVSSCTMSTNNVNSVSSSISQTISQTAVAIEQNALAILAIAIIFVVVLFFFFEFGVVELLNWKTLAVIAVFIIVYLVLSYYLGIWPFNAKASPPASGTTPPASGTTPPAS